MGVRFTIIKNCRKFCFLIKLENPAMKVILSVIVLLLVVSTTYADWPGHCPRLAYSTMEWQDGLGLWYKSAMSSLDPKVTFAYTRFEDACECNRPWFLGKEYVEHNDSLGREAHFSKIEPYVWNNLPSFWFVDQFEGGPYGGTYHHEIIDFNKDEYMLVFICQAYRGETHDEDAILYTRDIIDPKNKTTKDKYETMWKDNFQKNGITHVTMSWIG